MPTAKRKADSPKKRKAGRPPFQFDMELVKSLAEINCTDAEIIAMSGCGRQTYYDRLKSDENFRTVIESGREAGKQSLRRLQYESARKGNTTMQIWLGKQLLNQTDRARNEVSGPGGGPIESAGRIELVIIDPKNDAATD
jgi:hypothetical protein